VLHIEWNEWGLMTDMLWYDSEEDGDVKEVMWGGWRTWLWRWRQWYWLAKV